MLEVGRIVGGDLLIKCANKACNFIQFENTQLGLDWTELTAEHDVEFQRFRFLIRIPA